MRTPGVKSSIALSMQVGVVLLAFAALGFLLGEPHLEGRNAHATPFEIYFQDPFLAYVYAGSIPFFVALYRAFGMWGDVRQTGSFSRATVDALRTIQRCALIVVGFVAGAVIVILRFGDGEDRPGGLFMCLLVASAASIAALVAAKFARHLQSDLSRSEDRQP